MRHAAPTPNYKWIVFTFSFIACLVAAAASWLRGGKYHYRDEPVSVAPVTEARTPVTST